LAGLPSAAGDGESGLGRDQMTDEYQKPDPRVAEFKLLAEPAQRMAEKARSETARAHYLRIADDWRRLATEIQNSPANRPET
jgi:hypothetical protein